MTMIGQKRSRNPLLIAIRIDDQTQAALDAWRTMQPEPKPTRAEAGRFALRDWLTGKGLLKHRDDPEGAN